MPKLPVISGQDLVKLPIKQGFEFRRQHGSHVILRRGSQVLPIPLHSSVKKGLLLHLLKSMGLTREDLEKLL